MITFIISILLTFLTLGIYQLNEDYISTSYGIREQNNQELIPDHNSNSSIHPNFLTSAKETPAPGEKFLIQLRGHEFIPKPGIEISVDKPLIPSNESMHFLLQLYEIPDSEQRKKLFENQGIQMLEYLTGNTYLASTRISDLPMLSNTSGIRWAGPISVGDKISYDLKNGTTGTSMNFSKGLAILTIQFHADVNISNSSTILSKYGGNVLATVPDTNTITVSFPLKGINETAKKLAMEDSIAFIDVPGLPLEEQNDGARLASNISEISNPISINDIRFNGLTGKGIISLIYDSGMPDYRHPDIGSRIIQMDQSGEIKDHSTHVTGVLGGSGTNSNGTDSRGYSNGGRPGQWKGMAPDILFRSFVFNGNDALYDDGRDMAQDFHTAASSKGGIDLVSMSIGNNIVVNNYPCNKLGDYTNTAILIDTLVRDLKVPLFKSVGNEVVGLLPHCRIYSTITSPATSKNSIGIGAINSDNIDLYRLSSRGPTDDGRLKPDLVASGCQRTGDTGITSPIAINDRGAQNGYQSLCGTSFATPVAAGVGALLMESWHELIDIRPEPSMLKALMIHTSTDLGNPGPDYKFGWGAVNGGSATNLLRHDNIERHSNSNLGSHLVNDSIDNRDNKTYRISSNGLSEVKVTIAWDDPPSSRLSAKNLVNDIDLELSDPDGMVYMPFVLDPGHPLKKAARDIDNMNNVEMVTGSAKSGTWLVHVYGSLIPQGPQLFSLVGSHKIQTGD